MRLVHTCLASLLLVGACNDGDGSRPGPAREPDEYLGCATDENWKTFDETAEVVSDADAPQVDAPPAGSPATPPELTWVVSPTIAGSPNGDVATSCEQWNTGFAPQHLPPVSGTVYDLQLAVGGIVRHRALTTMQRWRATPEVWGSFDGAEVALRIRRMTLTQNAAESGPFVAHAPMTFTVAP